MIWMWDEEGEFKGQTVLLWRAYAEVLAEGIEYWLVPTTPAPPCSGVYKRFRDTPVQSAPGEDVIQDYLEKPYEAIPGLTVKDIRRFARECQRME